jgi:hypothetical protein
MQPDEREEVMAWLGLVAYAAGVLVLAAGAVKVLVWWWRAGS